MSQCLEPVARSIASKKSSIQFSGFMFNIISTGISDDLQHCLLKALSSTSLVFAVPYKRLDRSILYQSLINALLGMSFYDVVLPPLLPLNMTSSMGELRHVSNLILSVREHATSLCSSGTVDNFEERSFGSA